MLCSVEGCSEKVTSRGFCAWHYRNWRARGNPLISPARPRRLNRCSVEGCERETEARGWCSLHYNRWRAHGDPLRIIPMAERQFRQKMERPCSVEGCTQLAKARGWCKKHYRRWQDHGDPLHITNRPAHKPTPCAVPECDRRAITHGWCDLHYRRWKKSGDPLVTTRTRSDGTCAVEGCAGTYKANGYCGMHLQRLMRSGSLEVTRRARGTGTRSNGYVLLWMPELPGTGKRGQIFEHRLVMSDMIGRPLLPHENIHHRNGVRDDNRPENLELWSSMQPTGQKVTDKVRWAREILALYGDLVDRMQWA